MEKLELLVLKHPLLPFTRFHHGICIGCWSQSDDYLYGGYVCNELACNTAFHSKCAKSVPEINHYSHPNHLLKLGLLVKPCVCSLCHAPMTIGYSCSTCDYNLDIDCARRTLADPSPVHFDGHNHPLQLSYLAEVGSSLLNSSNCKVCDISFLKKKQLYMCLPCNSFFHVECVKFYPGRYHASHPKHPLKLLKCGPPSYSDKKCVLCGKEFEQHLHHCDICNFSICIRCGGNPPLVGVVSPTTHEHTLHLVPRLIDFTCNACGTQGDRSPYFCLQCNFMIHRECIDLPRVININRHDHRISYTSHLGHGNKTCGVCRKTMDGFYGGYSCSKCSSYVVHSRCATRYDVWDKVELEGTPEEIEEIEPFSVIDDHTIKHFSHDHNLKLNKDGKILHENILCEACVFQICDDQFYSCEQCEFILHKKCANLPLKKRHVANSIPFTLETNSSNKQNLCYLCTKYFTGFRYTSTFLTLDLRCASFLEPFFHECHSHPLYYKYERYKDRDNHGKRLSNHVLYCDDCPFTMDFWWAVLPKKVMKHRYDNHPLVLSYGETNVDSEYWCDVCETKVDSKKWFYTCDDCGVTLHISCVVGDFSYHKPGRIVSNESSYGVVVANTFMCRPYCLKCKSRCLLPFILKFSKPNIDVYFCSLVCYGGYFGFERYLWI